MKRLLTFLFLALMFSFTFSVLGREKTVLAAEEDLLISEVMYNPQGADSDHEWVEIYNAGTDSLTLIGGATPVSLRLVDGGSNRVLALEAAQGDMTLAAGEYAILAQNAATFLDNNPGYSGTLIEVSGMSLGNTSDTLALRIGTDGAVWSGLTYFNTWGGDENGKSLEKVDVLGSNEEINWTESSSLGGTPGVAYGSNAKPQAVFSSVDQAEVGKEIVFDASASNDTDGSVVLYRWDFGDGTSTESVENSINHAYNLAGNFVVVLEVSDNEGATDRTQKTITINDSVVYSEEVMLSELLPAPGAVTDWDGNGTADSNDEWIELCNTGSTSFDLGGYSLDDIADGGSNPYVFSQGEVLAVGECRAFYKKDTSLILNNDQDSVRLVKPDGSLLEEFAYSISHPDLSWAKDETGSWLEDETPSPGLANSEENQQDDDDDENDDDNQDDNGDNSDNNNLNDQQDNQNETQDLQTTSIAEAKKKALGTLIQVQGGLTATSEILGAQIIYMADASGGIKIKLDEGDYSTLALGDELLVSGILSESWGELYLKISANGSLAVLEHTTALAPQEIKTGDVGENLEGALVIITGMVTETAGDTFYVNDGSGVVKVYIKESTNIEKPRMQVGDKVQVVGIVSQYNDTYRILPRYQSDVIILGDVLGATTALPKTGGTAAGFFISCSVLVAGLVLRRSRLL